jgi:hypothetical protein
MRGAERPTKVKWTQPFLSPLTPLSHSAALQTFFDIADNIHEEDNVNQLLELTGNLPLAISLISSVAGAEGCDSALARWKSESTRMLSDGYDKRSSLDISIMLSFTSSRMTSGAQDLLSILSMLPDGFTDADLVQAELPITAILASKTTLLKTTLAFVDKERRIQVLAPIREHILQAHPPANALKLQLRKHFHDLLHLWTHRRDVKIAAQLLRNIGNVTGVLRDSLATECPDVTENYQSILNLNGFCRLTQDTYTPLLLKISEQHLFRKDNPIFGDYLMQMMETARYLPPVDVEAQIMLGNQYFETKDQLEKGKTQPMGFYCLTFIYSIAKWSRALGLYWYGAQADTSTALVHFQKALSLAESIGLPTLVGQSSLFMMSQLMMITGDLNCAAEHARRAQDYAEAFGGIFPQAQTLYLQARCQIMLANYLQAQNLIHYVTQLLHTWWSTRM